MKKILSIALVALLVASTAFAGFSGKAKLSLVYDTETESYGFKNGKDFSVDLDVASETAEAKGEGEKGQVKSNISRCAELSAHLEMLLINIYFQRYPLELHLQLKNLFCV